jgi:hypothetical protein
MGEKHTKRIEKKVVVAVHENLCQVCGHIVQKGWKRRRRKQGSDQKRGVRNADGVKGCSYFFTHVVALSELSAFVLNGSYTGVLHQNM